MSARLRFVTNSSGGLRLSEMEVGDELEFGRPERSTIVNDGDTRVVDISVDLEGDGSQLVQLAVESGDEPGVWAEAGRGIRLAERLDPGESASFWARARFGPDDMEGSYEF